ncbi:hypothetical protein PMAYCL1PPCAC_14164, partial [Pristionchus mayeri]
MVLPLLIVIATLLATACYYYYERTPERAAPSSPPCELQHHSSVEDKLYRTDQSIDSAASTIKGLASTSPAFTSEDDKRSPRRSYCPPHLISLPDRSPRADACSNPAHASHPSHQAGSRIAPTQDSCSPFRVVSVADLIESALTVADTPLEEDATQVYVSAEPKCAVVPLKERK